MNLKAWIYYHKRPSSTAVPKDTPYRDVSITPDMSRPIDVSNPLLVFRGTKVPGVTVGWENVNYVQIEDFDRYYYVDRVVLDGSGMVRLQCRCDVLASFAYEIGKLTAYVERSMIWNKKLVDTSYPLKPAINSIVAQRKTPFNAGKYPCFLLVLDNGGASSRLLTFAQYSAFMNKLWQSWNDIQGMNDVYASIVDPMQYVLGVYQVFVPQAVLDGTQTWMYRLISVDTLKIGNLTLNVPNYIVGADSAIYIDTEIPIPKHPDQGRYPYKAYPPYSDYTLYLPGYGWADLPDELIGRAAVEGYNLVIRTTCDCFSEKLRYKCMLQTPDGAATIPVGEYLGKWGTTWHASASRVDVSGTASAAGGAINSLLSLDFGGFVSGLGQTAQSAATPVVTSTGTTASATDLRYEEFTLVNRYKDCTPEQPDTWGYLTMESLQLGTLSGFVKCRNPQFPGNRQTGEGDPGFRGTGTEAAEINRLLTEGIYIE